VLYASGGDYTLRVSASGYQTSPDQSVTVVADSLTDVGVISLDPGSTTSGVRGRVEHAQEEQPIEGATVQLVEAGLSVETTTSGDFVLYASGGDYTLRVSADGFLPTDRDVTIPAAAVLDVGVIALVPEQAGDEVVIVLTWGDEPADVDAHLVGPSAPPDTSRFHVYWSNRGSRDAPPYAHLDRDVRYGQGPETITITQRLSGTYSYMVHDWSNRSSSPNDPSEELSASGANVRVIMNNQEVRNLIIPSGVPGTLWRVLDIDGTSGDIEIINTLEYSTSPGFTGKPARADKR